MASDHKRVRDGRKTNTKVPRPKVNMTEMVNQWQTPTAADGESTSRGGDRQGELLLGGQVRRWMSPVREDSEQTGAEGGRGPTLTSQTRTWFTPQSRDWKDTSDKQGNRKSPNLGTQIHAAGPCHQDPSNGTGSPRASSKGSINAEWETALMGFPLGWLAVSTSSALRLSATRKSPSV